MPCIPWISWIINCYHFNFSSRKTQQRTVYFKGIQWTKCKYSVSCNVSLVKLLVIHKGIPIRKLYFLHSAFCSWKIWNASMRQYWKRKMSSTCPNCSNTWKTTKNESRVSMSSCNSLLQSPTQTFVREMLKLELRKCIIIKSGKNTIMVDDNVKR